MLGGMVSRALAADLHAGHALIPAGESPLAPSVNSNGCPLSFELSNLVPRLSDLLAS